MVEMISGVAPPPVVTSVADTVTVQESEVLYRMSEICAVPTSPPMDPDGAALPRLTVEGMVVARMPGAIVRMKA